MMKRSLTMIGIVLALTLSLSTAAAAQAPVTDVRWTVTASPDYTVTNNGAQPLVRYTNCLRTNTTYTIPFSVTVTGTGAYNARFATVGEVTQFFNVSFAPASVSGNGTQTFRATATIRTGSRTLRQATQPANRFGIFLEPSPGAAPLVDSFLAVDVNCIAAAGTAPGMPRTGAGGMAASGLPLLPGSMAAVIALLATGGYAIRRRR